jgi:thymidylate synthase (FAD)
MKIIQPSVEVLTPLSADVFLGTIERAGRTCYKSEKKMTEDSARKFCATLIKNGHEAMLEHAPNISMRFICDRGVSHEIVRHRLFSFAQESTRYCNYGHEGEITVIETPFWDQHSAEYGSWEIACRQSEKAYMELIAAGASPQMARSVLPNSLKTEIIVTGDVREWRHFFYLRTDKPAHPQMRQVANMAYDIVTASIPVLFDDITPYRD